jgi:hypothetical protein
MAWLRAPVFVAPLLSALHVLALGVGLGSIRKRRWWS